MRNGKIARLPRDVRDALNLRMEKSDDGEKILDWLNSLPEVQESLKANFNGVPVSKQNLCEWRQGGFREWQIRQGFIDEACELSAWSTDLSDVIDAPLLAGDLVSMLATRYAAVLSSWDGEADPKTDEKLRTLRGLIRDVALVQRTMYLANKQKDEYNQHLEDEHQRSMKEIKEKMLAPFWAIHREQALAPLFGGGETGKKIAQYITAVESDLPLPKLDKEESSGQSQSNPVKPETESLARRSMTHSNGEIGQRKSTVGGTPTVAVGSSIAPEGSTADKSTALPGRKDAVGETPTAATETVALPAAT